MNINRITKRRLTDRKIVEFILQGDGINQISRAFHVGKSRIRELRKQAQECGYIIEPGIPGDVPIPPLPHALFPDPEDSRFSRYSESYQILDIHQDWIKDRLNSGWNAITIFQEIPVKVSRSSFYRYLNKNQLLKSSKKIQSETEIHHSWMLKLLQGKIDCRELEKTFTDSLDLIASISFINVFSINRINYEIEQLQS